MSSVHKLLARHAESDRPALSVLGEQPLSYRELFAAVGEVGRSLAGAGLNCADRIALVLPSNVSLAVALLGVASHAAAVPLNPRYRERELDFYFSAVKAKAVIVPEQGGVPAREVALRRGLTVIELCARPHWGTGRFELRRCASNRIDADVSVAGDDDIALVLHTSGTTGSPKIVPIRHARLCMTAENIRRALDLSDSDRCLQCMPLFHVHGLLNALLASLTGGSTVLCMPGFEPFAFWQWYSELQPTWYTAVPTLHQTVLAMAEARHLEVAAQLRLVRSSSAPLAPITALKLEALFQAPVIESYGMTEIDQITTNFPRQNGHKPGSVGLPGSQELEVLVIDSAGGRMSFGEVGEVAVRGPNVFDGYEDEDPATNQAAFVGGLFRTGDLGYLDRDGFLFLIGRAKDIINRAGEKVAPREIDEVLLEHPAVQEAAAFAIIDDLLGEDVVAAVVLHNGKEVSAGQLRIFAAERLADFKVPRRIYFVNELPKGPTGKLRRAELSQRFAPLRHRNESEAAALNQQIERALLDLLRDIKPWARFESSAENLATLGFDSLDMRAATLAISRGLGVELSPTLLYEYPSVRDITAHLLDRYCERCVGMIGALGAQDAVLPR